MQPVVTLTTDFGLRQPFVALMKAIIHERCPDSRVVDLTHEVAPFAVVEAGFWLERCFQYFPPGSLHVAVVDPGVGSSRPLLAVEWARHLFLAPDNGLLGRLVDRPGARARRVAEDVLAAHGLPRVSATFHGRDLFAPLAGDLAAGRLAWADLGPTVADASPSPVPSASRVGEAWHGEVLLIDRFGNCFSNIEIVPNLVSSIRAVRFGTRSLPLVRTYSDSPAGSVVALVNSFGVMEAACVQGRADEVLGLAVGSPVEVFLEPRAGSPVGDAGNS
jgi:S-adenosylmethionine hydrolase